MIKLNRKHKNSLLVLFFTAMFILISLTPLVPGNEIETRLMVNSVGFDVKEDGTVEVSAETINGGKNEFIHGEGRVLSDALMNLNERYGRKIELGHCGLVVLGSDITTPQAVAVMINILSDGMINTGCSVVSADVSAREFMQSAVLLTKSTGGGVSEYVSYADAYESVTIPSILETMQSLSSKSGAAVVPIIGFREKPSEDGKSGSIGGSDSTEQSDSQNDSGSKVTEINPSVTVRVFGKESYELEESDARGLIWITSRTKGGLADADMDFDGKRFELSSVIEEKKQGIEAEFADRPIVTFSVEARLKFTQRYELLDKVEEGHPIDEVLDNVNAAYEARITDDIKRVAERSVKDDFLGIRTKLYRADPKRYNEWSGDLSEAEYRFDIKVRVV